ncbi:hypothetical protein [Streptomyces sp. CAU 1734]|uniref:hypothetical protein n=1 Tax=Streptomyces sp. CAU 1734 TaxID=3140360 RepID=UPI00326057D0
MESKAGCGPDPGPGIPSSPWRWHPRDVTAAAAACTVQLAVAGTVWFIVRATVTDDYDRPVAVLGPLCLLLLGPPAVAAAGLLQAVLLPLPAVAFADWSARRHGVPAWRPGVLAAMALGALWAVPCALLGAGFPAAWAWIAAGAVLPLLAVAYYRRREARRGSPYPGRSIWFHAFAQSALLVPAAVGVMAVATATGVLREYEPPEPTAARLTGAWEGPGEAVVRLDRGGRAAVTAVPDAIDGEPCDGTGTWSLDTSGHRDRVILDVKGCGSGAEWLISGTADRPELVLSVGDPDAGDLRIFVRAASGSLVADGRTGRLLPAPPGA